ncbi:MULTISPECIES: formate dehydrogenase subunit delta [unclassified Herbaspirillum]|uniref:formate dehydrogenase subunit delta n=1 Tax=unclassified Herbaspirillum TaxID=2624150 RepID=UPI00383ACF67
MNVQHLIKMANQIGTFFSTMPDRVQAEKDLATHIKRFWEPRMRRALLEYVEQEGGSELSEIVLTAVKRHSAELQVAIQ